MKYIISFFCVGLIALILALSGLNLNEEDEILLPENYLRIHIRANSNEQIDQEIKYKVKDAVVEALIPVLADCQSKGEAIQTLKDNFNYIEKVANNVLSAGGFEYSSRATFSKEYFPTRVYDEVTLPEGEYDSLILNLGSGEGNNWWCVVYPAFCFLETKNCDNIVYISQIWDIIKNVTR